MSALTQEKLDASTERAAPEKERSPLVSIVIPVWGAEKFLAACLDSILAQTMPDWECILVDDGSPDNSGKICDDYAARDSRFVVIHRENGGVCAARNTGLRAACGRYLTFCDNDDKMHPRLLEWAVNAIQAMPGGFVCWRYTRDASQFCTGKETGSWKRYLADDSFFIDRTMGWTQWNKLYPRDKIEQADVWFTEDWYDHPRNCGEDKDFQDRFWNKWRSEQGDMPVCMMDDCLYYWNPDN